MNPVLALGLLATLGLAATRLPRLSVRRLPHGDLLLAGGAPLVLVGVLLGPGIGLLDRPVLRALAPVTALAIGWVGAVVAARFEWRLVRRLPGRVGALALIEALAAFTAVALGAWALGRAVPGLRAAWVPELPAVLTLGAIAAVSGPGAVTLVARGLGVRRALAHALAQAATLHTAFGALGFTLALALYYPRDPENSPVVWLALALGSGVLLGILFLWLTRRRPAADDRALALLGTMVLGAGVGYAADLSPFVVCAVATLVIVNRLPAPDRRRVVALLDDWEHPIHVVFLITAGALLRLPTAWILVAVPLLAALRIAGKWAAVRFAPEPVRVAGLPAHLGLATVAQGVTALALAINFYITYGGAAAGAMVTTVILGIAVAQVAAPPLMALALRGPRLTAPAPIPELS
ncbi:MAG: hypothetical protein ACREL9_02105 [Gemmatimonadales bacterium]